MLSNVQQRPIGLPTMGDWGLDSNHDSKPSGQSLADSVGNPRRFWLLGEGIHTEIWDVSETRIHVEIQGKFLNRV